MLDMLKTFLPRAVQDLIQASAGLLVAHGWLTPGQQEQSYIGATFFLIMLLVNHEISQNRKVIAAAAGADAVGGTLSPSQASAIAKGQTP